MATPVMGVVFLFYNKYTLIMNKVIISILLVFSSLFAMALSPTAGEFVTVEIDYGKSMPTKTIEVEWTENMSALEALQKSASVVTHPVAGYVFVTSIDEVAADRGDMAWYYKVNGESAKELAISLQVNPGDVITWTFVEDVCSKTVDE